MGKTLDEHQLTLGMHLMRGRSLLDTYRLQPGVLQMHLLKCGGTVLVLFGEAPLLLAESKDPNPALLSFQEHVLSWHVAFQAQGPGVSGDTIPKHPTQGSPASK